MMEWRQCTVEDIDTIRPYESEMFLPDTLKRCLQHSVVCVVDGTPIGAGGVQEMYAGVGEAWTLLSDRIVQEHPMAISRFAIRWLDRLQAEGGFVRVQTMCENAEKNLNWIETLGFVREGLMKNSGINGKGDYWMCGRVR